MAEMIMRLMMMEMMKNYDDVKGRMTGILGERWGYGGRWVCIGEVCIGGV